MFYHQNSSTLIREHFLIYSFFLFWTGIKENKEAVDTKGNKKGDTIYYHTFRVLSLQAVFTLEFSIIQGL